MGELVFLIGVLFLIGIVVLLAKLGLFLIILPIKIGFGLGKLLLTLLLAIPVLIVGVVLLAAAVPVLLIAVPVICLLALPFILFFKLIF